MITDLSFLVRNSYTNKTFSGSFSFGMCYDFFLPSFQILYLNWLYYPVEVKDPCPGIVSLKSWSFHVCPRRICHECLREGLLIVTLCRRIGILIARENREDIKVSSSAPIKGSAKSSFLKD